jgi:MFS family permease
VKSGVWIGSAAVAGCLLLAYSVPRAHPAASWNVRFDRQQSVVRAREISAAFSIDTSSWSVIPAAATDGKPEYFARQHPADEAARRFTPVYPKIEFVAPGKPYRVSVDLSAAGDVNSWERRQYPKPAAADPARARVVAENAFIQIVRHDRSAFHTVTDAAPAGDSLMFAWERNGALTERFEAAVDGNGIIKAALKPLYSREFEDALQRRKRIRSWFVAAVGICIYAIGTVLSAIVYLYWAVRRAVKHRFVFQIVALAAAGGIVSWFNWNYYDEAYDTTSTAGVWMLGALLLLLICAFYFVLAGAADAVGIPAKLVTLRSVFSASALNKQLGRSVLTGLLCGPLLAGVPLWISSLHILGSQQTGDYDAALMYSPNPALQAVNIVISPAILGLFGFGAGFLARFIKKKIVAASILFVVGTLLFATYTAPSETSPAAFLLSSALVFVIYQQLFERLDLLAALSGAWCTQAIWNSTALLLQPARSLHVSGLTGLVLLGAAVGCAALIAWRGRELHIAVEGPAAAASQRETLMSEFSIAHRVQQQMLPERPPEIPGCTIAASCHPAREVGGDLFDFLKLPDGRWTISVGDVSGKGVPAALYMTLTKGLLIATTGDSTDLLDIIGNVNGHLHAATDHKTFVTMALGAFDPETRAFDHVRAGHNPIVWRRASDKATSMLNVPGIGLGLVSDRHFRRASRVDRIQLDAGDLLVFYSDGLTEAMNLDNEQFGDDRLMEAVKEAGALDASGVREHVLTRVKTFLNGVPAQDDMTLVVLRVN